MSLFIPEMSSKSDSFRRFTRDDSGKPVVTAAGDVVGDIDRVKEGKAYVKPDPGLLEGLGSAISSPWVGVDPLPLDDRQVASVTDEAVVLKPVESESRVASEDR